jgi:hypothetical protein
MRRNCRDIKINPPTPPPKKKEEKEMDLLALHAGRGGRKGGGGFPPPPPLPRPPLLVPSARSALLQTNTPGNGKAETWAVRVASSALADTGYRVCAIEGVELGPLTQLFVAPGLVFALQCDLSSHPFTQCQTCLSASVGGCFEFQEIVWAGCRIPRRIQGRRPKYHIGKNTFLGTHSVSFFRPFVRSSHI